jgi:hypothetical protein
MLGLAFVIASTEAADEITDIGREGTIDDSLIAKTDDVIAIVGKRAIRFHELTHELDKGALPGVSVPGYGTPERRQILERLLDQAVRNELLYLDALRKGIDQDFAYQRERERFKVVVLAGLFRERQAPTGALRVQWRDGIAITINEGALDPARDAERSDDEVLATVADASITWGDAKARLLVATRRAALSGGATDAAAERRKVLDQLIDVLVMALRAEEAGLNQDPAYLRQVADFKEMGLAAFHYRQLAVVFTPTEEEIVAYAEEHTQAFGELDERARRAIVRSLIEQKVAAYANRLQEDGIEVTVDEAKLNRLLAQEAEQQAATGEGARK